MTKRRPNNRLSTPSQGKAAPRSVAGLQRAGATVTDATRQIAQMQAMEAAQRVAPVEALPRDPSWATLPFAPGMPLVPAAINPPRPDTGRPEPRRWDYPTAWNLPGDQRLIPWKVLRDSADAISMMRRAIEVRKGNAVSLDWTFAPDKRAVQQVMRDDGSTQQDAEKAVRERNAEPIARLTAFWCEPDKGNGWAWDTWLMALMEEHFVLDALALYPRLTLGGDLFSVEVLDGSTIKPLLDARGNRPLPPQPAYQQILNGFPRGEFRATVSEDDVLSGFASDALYYSPRNVRSWTPYGYSPVEQALVDADTFLRRQGWMRDEYTAGSLPTSWLLSDLDMTPQQVRAYEQVINAEMGGNSAERHRFRVLPKGFTTEQMSDAAERYKPDYDEFLIKLLHSHFDVMPTELGIANPKSGLGGKGHQDGEQDSIMRRQRALLDWISAVVTRISRDLLGCPPEVSHAFLGLESEDENTADEVADRRMKRATLTVNEDRDRIGLARLPQPEADMPFFLTATGPVFLDGSSEPPPMAAGIGPDGLPIPGGPAEQAMKQGAETHEQTMKERQSAPPPTAAPKSGGGGTPPATHGAADARKADEARAFLAYITKRDGRLPRPFAWQHLDPAEATVLHTALDTAGVEGVKAAVADLVKSAAPSARD